MRCLSTLNRIQVVRLSPQTSFVGNVSGGKGQCVSTHKCCESNNQSLNFPDVDKPACYLASVLRSTNDGRPRMYAQSNMTLDMSSLYLYRIQQAHCCPSALSELRPARRISSVDNKFTAITELNRRLAAMTKWQKQTYSPRM